MSAQTRASCVICAWRESCQKKYSIVDPSRCQDFSLDLSIKDAPGRKGVKLMVEGGPGSGKSTLVERVVTRLGEGVRAGGFYTREMRKSGERVGFKIITLDKMEAVLAHVDHPGNIKVGRYAVNLEGLERVAVQSIERAIRDSDLIIIDEIGRMETLSGRFCEMVAIALDSDVPVLATVPSDGTPFISEVKSRPGVRLLCIEAANRDALVDEVVGIIRGSSA